MAVDVDGEVKMRGHTGAGVPVRVVGDNDRLRIVSGNELIGEWPIADIGIAALQDGFSIRVEGEEFILTTSDDAALAEMMHLRAASPRLARQIVTRHNPEDPEPVPEPPAVPSNLAAIGFAVAGALIVLGGIFLNISPEMQPALAQGAEPSGADFWVAFVIGGVFMVAVAYVMSIGARNARIVALFLLVGVIGLFGWTVANTEADTGELTAYGFVAGGIVIGIAVLVSGSLLSEN